MTREEAINRLQDAKDGYKEYLTDEALEMAIQALEKENIYNDGEHYVTISKALYDKLNIDYETLSQKSCDKCRNNHTSFCGNCKDYDEFEFCDDAVSRQAVLDQTYFWSKDEFLRVTNPFDYLRKRINSLSPVMQKSVECEDTISRTDAIKALQKVACYSAAVRARMIGAIEELPPAMQKSGYWIDADGDNAICGCCNRLNHLYGTYCKHCGAKMESENKE